MGSIMSAINDDENDWYDFKKKSGIYYLDGVNKWEVYSKEETFAREGYEKLGLRGAYLIRYVEFKIQEYNDNKQLKAEQEEYNLYLKLRDKWENKNV